jgi:polygalacturonase
MAPAASVAAAVAGRSATAPAASVAAAAAVAAVAAAVAAVAPAAGAPPAWPAAPDPDVWARGLRVFNITDYGAVGDNSTINTRAIAATVAAASAAGGGLVRVPPGGAFKTGAVALATDVYLYLPAGAVLLGSANATDYTSVVGGDWGRWDVLHTANASRTGVIGDPPGGGGGGSGGGGTLQGPMWQMISGYDPAENQLVPVRWAGLDGCVGECRPRLAVFEDCADVVLADVHLADSSDWTTLFRRVTGVTWVNVTVWGSQQWPNNDGVDLESTSEVWFRNVSIFTGDDNIVFASGNTNDIPEPWPQPPGAYTPTANVLIEDVALSSYSSAVKAEAIFQRYHGDVANITVRRATITASARGLGMQQRTGAGAFRNFTFRDVTVEARGVTGDTWWGDGEAVWLTSVPESVGDVLGGIHDVTFINVSTASEQGVVVVAAGQGNATAGGAAIDGIHFSDVTVVVAVLGNATRPGVHDLRPIDAGNPQPDTVAANVTGYWFEHVAGVTVTGGGVAFAGPPQPTWARGVCVGGTPDSVVAFDGVGCDPAG